jgi:probable rRNA maturation factor
MVTVEITGRLPAAVPRSLVNRLASICCQLSGFSGSFSVSLAIVEDREIRRLNKRFRGVNKVTDVLSFGYRPEAGFADMAVGLSRLGDVVIASARVRQQASAIGRPVGQEFCLLFVHGLLHLFGLDHDTAKREATMFAIQQEALMRAEVL